MRRILVGQVLLILCCIVYLLWWYRGYRPNVSVDRFGGINGILFRLTAAAGISGLIFSLGRIEEKTAAKLNGYAIAVIGVVACIAMMLITRYGFGRIVTTELILIAGWTVLETTVINRLNAAGILSDNQFGVMCVVIAAAFTVSMILYVAYYRMEEMKAFYAAMIPLVTEAAAMAVLTGMMIL